MCKPSAWQLELMELALTLLATCTISWFIANALCNLCNPLVAVLVGWLCFHPSHRANCCRHIPTHWDEACTASALSTQGHWQEAALTERHQTNYAQERESFTTASEGDCFISTFTCLFIFIHWVIHTWGGRYVTGRYRFIDAITVRFPMMG